MVTKYTAYQHYMIAGGDGVTKSSNAPRSSQEKIATFQTFTGMLKCHNLSSRSSIVASNFFDHRYTSADEGQRTEEGEGEVGWRRIERRGEPYSAHILFELKVRFDNPRIHSRMRKEDEM